MEESLSRPVFDLCIDEAFDLPEQDWILYPPLTLAYLGDAVFETVIRTVLVKQHCIQAWKLHREASGIVSARAQSRMADALLPVLTEEEKNVYRRGRNAKPDHNAKNASREEYLKATGLEAVIGYLYLNKEHERIMHLLRKGISSLREQEGLPASL